MDTNESLYLQQEYSDAIEHTLLANVIVKSAILCVGVLGNLTVLIMYCTKMDGYLTEPRYFIPILAFYDLLACISAVVYIFIETYMWISFTSDILCKVLIAFSENTTLTSTAFLMVISIQRYVKICRPHSKQMTLFWRRFTVVCVILINLISVFSISCRVWCDGRNIYL